MEGRLGARRGRGSVFGCVKERLEKGGLARELVMLVHSGVVFVARGLTRMSWRLGMSKLSGCQPDARAASRTRLTMWLRKKTWLG